MPKDLQQLLYEIESDLRSEQCHVVLTSKQLERRRGLIAFANKYDLSYEECKKLIMLDAKRQAGQLGFVEKFKLFWNDIYWLSFLGLIHNADKHELYNELLKAQP